VRPELIEDALANAGPVRPIVTACGGTIVGEEYHALDHTDYRGTVERIMSSGAEVVFNTIVPPGLTPFLEQLHDAGFASRGGHALAGRRDRRARSRKDPPGTGRAR
jgi:hypothetical protein